MEEKKETSLGERVAEKFYDVASTDPETLQRLAALIDLEVKKNLGDEIQTAPGLPNEETGLAPCPFCGGKAIRGMASVWCANCGATTRRDFDFSKEEVALVWNRRAPLTSLPSQSPTLPKERGNPSPLIEALREIRRIGSITPSDKAETFRILTISEIDSLLALAGQDTEEDLGGR